MFARHCRDLIVINPLRFLVHTVVNDFKKLAGEIRLVAVRQMAAVAQIHSQHLVARFQHGKINCHVRAGAGMRLDVRVFGAEKFFGAINCELLNRVNVLAAAIPTFFRIAFGVFVREHRTLRFHDSGRSKIFRRDQLDVFLLPRAFVVNRVSDFRINICEAQIRRRKFCIHFQHAPFVTSAFKFCSDECRENFLGEFSGSFSRAQTKHVGVVMLAAGRRAFFVADQRRAHAGDFVGRDAHAHTAGANEQTEFGFARSDGFGGRLGEIRIIIRRIFARRAKIADRQAAFAQKRLERFLEFVTAVIRAECKINDGCGCLIGIFRKEVVLFHKFQKRDDALLNLIAALDINMIRAANRIADVFFVRLQRLVKFAQQKSFFRRLRIQQRHRVRVAVRHAQNQIRRAHQLRRQRAAALPGNINTNLAHRLDGMMRRQFAVNRANARRHDAELATALDGVTEKPLGHRAATDIAGAKK